LDDLLAQVAIYTRYGPFNNTELTYPDCQVHPDFEKESDEYPVTTEVQPFECTRVKPDDSNGRDDAVMLYQTIQCIY